MKKAYIEPSVMVEDVESTEMICSSNGVTSSGATEEITYGGIDEEGTKDPASRRHRDVWEDEDEKLN